MSRELSQADVVAKLREADRYLAQGKAVAEVARALGVSEVTYRAWRKEHADGAGAPETAGVWPGASEHETPDLFSKTFARAPLLMSLSALDDGTYLDVNDAFTRLSGFSREEAIGLRSVDLGFISANDREELRRRIVRSGRVENLELELRRKDGSALHCAYWGEVIDVGGRQCLLSLASDITERKHSEAERAVTIDLLRLINSGNDLHALLRDVTCLLREWSGCEAVAIRLRDGDDYPYFETRGFALEFVQAENSLCTVDDLGNTIRDSAGNPVLECMCGNVIRSRFDPSLPFFTERGSFWTNSTTDLLATTTEEDRHARTRNRCHGEGYESVALVPLRHGAESLGLLQFNDRRRDRFMPTTIALFERLADNLAIGLAQRKADQALREQRQLLADAERLAGLGAWVWHVQQDRWELSDNWLALHGCKDSDLTSEKLLRIAHPDDVPAVRRASAIASSGQGPYQIEHRIIRQDTGEVRHVQAFGEAKRDAAGQVVSVTGAALDITDRKRDEQARRESEHRFRSLVEAAPVSILLVRDGKYILGNPASARLLGYASPDAMAGVDVLQTIAPEFHDIIRRRMERATRGVDNEPIEIQLVRTDGRRVWTVSTSVSVEIDGAPTAVIVGQDITERKRAEQELRDASLRLETTVRSANVGLWDWDLITNRVFYSDEWKRQIGYEPHQIGDSLDEWSSRAHPDDVGPTLDAIQRFIDRGEPRYEVEFRFRHRDGHYLWIMAQASIVRDKAGRPIRVIGSHVDITARKQSAEALARSEREKSLILNSTTEMFAYYDLDLRIQWANQAAADSVGAQPSDLIGRKCYELWHQRDEPCEVCPVIKARETLQIQQAEVTSPDGRHWFLRGYPVLDAAGNPTALIEFGQDITERKRAEEERNRLTAAIEQAADAIVVTDINGSIRYVNSAFEQITGYTRGDVIGQNPRILKSGEHDGAFYRTLWSTIMAGRSWEGRFVNRRKDGSTYVEEATISPVRDAAGNIADFVAAKRDITAQIRLEEQLRQAQKMDAIGQLAGGIAHDFNNILTAILGNAEIAGQEAASDAFASHALIDAIEQIQRGGDRAASLTRQLLAFSRRQTSQPRVFDLNAILVDLEKMLRRLLTENIAFDMHLSLNLWPLRADPSQIDQVVVNLVVNARDAMPAGGTLSLATSNLTLPDVRHTASGDLPAGRYVALTVCDTGCGIDRKTMERVFEPFFTTKELGRGTGLGLATVYGIVKQAGGSVDVQSHPDEGTTFSVYLPAADDKAATRPGPRESPVEAASGETILLCEDDQSVRELAARFLRSAGYNVVTASSSAQAHQTVARHTGNIDLIVTDVIMTDTNGRELVDRLREVVGDVPTLYISGYTADLIAHHGVLDVGIEFLEKPFNRDTLLRRVRAVLDAHR